MKHSYRYFVFNIVLILATLLSSCAITKSQTPQEPLDKQAKWVLLPLVNNTETPLAGGRAEAITESLLRNFGVHNLTRYPASFSQETLFESNGQKLTEQGLVWAKEQQATYAVIGHVDEWRYKVGVDGEPAAGIMLQIVDVNSGKVIWSGVGGKSGWARESLAAVAQKLIYSVLEPAFKITK